MIGFSRTVALLAFVGNAAAFAPSMNTQAIAKQTQLQMGLFDFFLSEEEKENLRKQEEAKKAEEEEALRLMMERRRYGNFYFSTESCTCFYTLYIISHPIYLVLFVETQRKWRSMKQRLLYAAKIIRK